MALGEVDAVDQGLKHVHGQEQKVHQGGADGRFALAHGVEQRFGFVGQAVKLLEPDDSAVAFEVVEIPKQVVDQVGLPFRVLFHLKKAVGKIGNVFFGFFDKVAQVPFAKGGEGVFGHVGKAFYPGLYVAGLTNAGIGRRGGRAFRRCFRFFFFFFFFFGVVITFVIVFGGAFFLGGGRSGGNHGRAVGLAGHDGVQSGYDAGGIHVAFGAGGVQVVDHLAQGVGGGQNGVHNLAGDGHGPFAQLVKDVLGLVGEAVHEVQAQKAGSPFEGVHGPEYLVEQRKVVRGFFKLQQVRLDGFEVFSGFNDKIRE